VEAKKRQSHSCRWGEAKGNVESNAGRKGTTRSKTPPKKKWPKSTPPFAQKKGVWGNVALCGTNPTHPEKKGDSKKQGERMGPGQTG